MGGPEAVQRMQQDRPDLPVLFTSGYTEHEWIDRGLADGKVRLLSKPFSPAVLLREVRLILDEAAEPAEATTVAETPTAAEAWERLAS